MVPFSLRKAKLEDVPLLETLIAGSARGLGRQDYTEAQLESALDSAFGVDTGLKASHSAVHRDVPVESIFGADGALTREYLLERGYCCENGCRNCPYGFGTRGEKQEV
jgi:hypothetical protein